MTFEESLKQLEDMSSKMRDRNTSLDEAVKCYEKGIEAYNNCSKILNEAKQKIEIINR